MINSGAASAAAGAMSPTLWADLRRFVAQAQAHAELAPADHAYELAWPLTARLDALLWPIALSALELLTSPQLIRVKKCAGCPWVFLDQSKNLSRRWCAMDDCGTHERFAATSAVGPPRSSQSAAHSRHIRVRLARHACTISSIVVSIGTASMVSIRHSGGPNVSVISALLTRRGPNVPGCRSLKQSMW
jgi:CGNR zinc finger